MNSRLLISCLDRESNWRIRVWMKRLEGIWVLMKIWFISNSIDSLTSMNCWWMMGPIW